MANEDPISTIQTPESEGVSPTRIEEHEQAVQGAVSKEELYERLQQMPIEKLRAIITNQIDLEIRLKHKELSLVEDEIGKCESQMITLRKFFKIPSNINFDNEPNGFTHKYSQLLSEALNVNYKNVQKISESKASNPVVNNKLENPSSYQAPIEDPNLLSTHTYRTRSTTSSLRPPSISSERRYTLGCLYRRTDGVIVKLTCPNCSRSNFSSAQGFLNHSRIAHSKEYTSQDAAALQCGEILPDDEQDEEGLASLQQLRLKNLDPSKSLNINEIRFDGLNSSMNMSHNNKQDELSTKTSNIANNNNSSTNLVLNKNNEMNDNTIDNNSNDNNNDNSNNKGKRKHIHLMKKMMEKGITQSSDEYDKLIKETIDEVKDSHLFSGESEIVDHELEGKGTNIETQVYKPQRRKSRGNVGIAKSGTYSNKKNKNPSLPKLKIKLKRSLDDKKEL